MSFKTGWVIETYPAYLTKIRLLISMTPYGVREKGQRVGIKGKKESWIVENVQNANHYPEKAKYSISSTFLDLIDLAGKLLVVGGRLLFWFPVFDDELVVLSLLKRIY
ncbi:hypothetical protein DINM_000509 [Dirofilaria immitis]|nr:hypothetical protein [Dirofilaria immitis]